MAGLRGGNLYIGEDAIVFWGDRHIPHSGLYDNNLERFVTDATLTFVLKDANGAAVSGSSGSLTYLSGTEGMYEGVLEDGCTATLTEGAIYYLELTATASGDRVGFRRLQFTASYHSAA